MMMAPRRAAAAMALILIIGHGAGDRSRGCPPDHVAGRFLGLQGEPCDCCRCAECDVSRCDRADCDVRTSSPPPVISWRTWRATLPIFRTRAALDEHTGWRAYLDMVYSLETLTFPLDVSTFLFFYHHELAVLPPPLRAPEQRPTMGCPDAANASAGAAALAALLAACRGARTKRSLTDPEANRRFGDAFVLWPRGVGGGVGQLLGAPGRGFGTTWLYPFSARNVHTLRRGFTNGTWVEVYHAKDGGEHARGKLWMYWATGSGIYYNVGRTTVRPRGEHVTDAEYDVLRAAGFDSIQYSGFSEEGLFKYEIVDLRDPGVTSTCPTSAIARHWRQGWDHSLACDCVAERRRYLNCGPDRPTVDPFPSRRRRRV